VPVKKNAALTARETKTEMCRHGNSAFLLNTIFTDAVRRGAQFLQWRVREYAGYIAINASTIPRARASICERRARRRRMQHRQCQFAHVLLRNCAIAKLIANGSPYLYFVFSSPCGGSQTRCLSRE